MRAEARERAIELRTKYQLGYGAIAKEIGVAKSTLSRWLQDLPLSEERVLELRRSAWTRGEAKRERFRETMRKKRMEVEVAILSAKKKEFSHTSRQAVYIAGLMLYAAEGDKKSRAEIAFTNTDAQMVRFFALWLERFLGVDSARLRIQLHLYENMNIPAEEAYWMKELKMKKPQLCKSQVRQLRSKSFSYRDTARHGTCKLYIGSVPKKTELMLSIKAFFDTYNGRSQV